MSPRGAEGRSLVVARADTLTPLAVQWLWQGRVPFGMLTILEGVPGQGKTLAAFDLAARVSAGRAMPLTSASEGTVPRDAIVVSYEDDAACVVRPRLEAAGANLERCHVVQGVLEADAEAPLVIPDDLELLASEVRRTNAGLVVIDPLMAALSGQVDAHRDQDVRRALSRLRALAEGTGTAIVLIRHLRKAAPDGQAVLAGQGSIGIIGAARTAHVVAPAPDDPSQRVLAPVKNNVGPLLAAVRYEIRTRIVGGNVEAPCVEWLGECDMTADQLTGPPPDAEERGAMAEALEWLRAELGDGGKAAKDLKDAAKAAGIAWATVRRAEKLAGIVHRRSGFGPGGQWEWALPRAVDDQRRSPAPDREARAPMSTNAGEEVDP